MVPGAGLEPACLSAPDFKSSVYTNSTTRAHSYTSRKRRAGKSAARNGQRKSMEGAPYFCYNGGACGAPRHTALCGKGINIPDTR